MDPGTGHRETFVFLQSPQGLYAKPNLWHVMKYFFVVLYLMMVDHELFFKNQPLRHFPTVNMTG